MLKEIKPFELTGMLHCPSSKSYFQRALAVGAFADGSSNISYFSLSKDVEACLRVVKALGTGVQQEEGIISLEPKEIKPTLTFNVGESGLALRMFAGILATQNCTATINGEGSLLSRPLEPIVQQLESLGTPVPALFPLNIKGKVAPQEFKLDGSFSSQFITGVLIGLVAGKKLHRVEVVNPKSVPYLRMTVKCLQDFGAEISFQNNCFEIMPAQLKGQNYQVEGDWSAASNFIVSALLRGSIRLQGLQQDSLQADSMLLDVLDQGGARYGFDNDQFQISEQAFPAFDVDATEAPDLIPSLVLLAAGVKGKSRIIGTNRLIHKESNRLKALLENFGKMGLSMQEDQDALIINGTGSLNAAKLKGFNDHRMVMTSVFAAGLCKGVSSITDNNAVAKSYPQFFSDLAQVSVPSKLQY